MVIQDRIFSLADEGYANFQSKLVPGIPRERFIGLRIPKARALGKEVIKEGLAEEFLHDLPHYYYDENILQSMIISEIGDFSSCIEEVNRFLPYIDNWAVCDSLSPKVFKKNRDRLIDYIVDWLGSSYTYSCRFGIKTLMSHYLDDDFKPAYLDLVAGIHSSEYYVQMAAAWFFASALTKKWQASLPYLEDQSLDLPVHNKTIQKARESRQITREKKDCLKGLKR